MSVKSKPGRLVATGAAFLVGAVLLAGCGSDSESSPKDDFIAQANTICSDYEQESAAAEDAFTEAIDAGDLETAATVFEDQAGAMTAAVDEMEALEVPPGDEQVINEFIALARDTVQVTLQAADAIRADDRQALDAAIAQGDALDARSDEIATEYGLTDCVSNADEQA